MGDREVVAWLDPTGGLVAHRRMGAEPSTEMRCGLRVPSLLVAGTIIQCPSLTNLSDTYTRCAPCWRVE